MTAVPPGAVTTADEPVVCNEGRETETITVENTGDRPVQVGSHFHFFEVNPALAFDRLAAYGFRLDIPAGTAVRFEPGQRQTVDLVAVGGDRVVRGFGGLVNGSLDDEDVHERALERAAELGYLATAVGEGFLDADDVPGPVAERPADLSAVHEQGPTPTAEEDATEGGDR